MKWIQLYRPRFSVRVAGIEFPEAVGVAAATYAQLLMGRHGGFVEAAGEKKLTNEQLFEGAQIQIITLAMQSCSKQIPDDVKKKVEEALEKQKDS